MDNLLIIKLLFVFLFINLVLFIYVIYKANTFSDKALDNMNHKIIKTLSVFYILFSNDFNEDGEKYRMKFFIYFGTAFLLSIIQIIAIIYTISLVQEIKG